MSCDVGPLSHELQFFGHNFPAPSRMTNFLRDPRSFHECGVVSVMGFFIVTPTSLQTSHPKIHQTTPSPTNHQVPVGIPNANQHGITLAKTYN